MSNRFKQQSVGCDDRGSRGGRASLRVGKPALASDAAEEESGGGGILHVSGGVGLHEEEGQSRS